MNDRPPGDDPGRRQGATKAPLVSELARATRSATAPLAALRYSKNAVLRPAGCHGTGLSGHPEVAGDMSDSFSLVGPQTGLMATGQFQRLWQ